MSNTHDAAVIPSMLVAMDGGHHFETVVLSIEVGRRKPHPSIYRVALDAMGCESGEVVFVGDSFEADYEGPRRVGMSALLIDPGGQHGAEPSDRLDAVLDVEGDTATLGKRQGADEALDKPTYPALLGLAEAKRLALDMHESALAALESFGSEVDPLRALSAFIIERRH